jgi:hypothetical protein
VEDHDVDVFGKLDVVDCVVGKVDDHRVFCASEHDAQLIKKSAGDTDSSEFRALSKKCEVHRRTGEPKRECRSNFKCSA